MAATGAADREGLRGVLGPRLSGKDGEKDTDDVLKGKDYVLLYFGAHWCGPCRQLMPKIAEYYERHRASKNFEVVFVSADKSEGEFESYFRDQPWVAVPWSGPRESVERTFKVQSYPTLLALNSDGTVVSPNILEDLLSDPSGEKFPYPRKGFWEIVDKEVTKLRASNGDTFPKEDLRKYDYIGLYFSAHWCPPCRAFTPRLVEWYNEQAKKHNMLMLFISKDRDAGSFEEYHNTMSWPAIAWDDPSKEAAVRQLSRLCSVEGIPTLAFFDKDGKMITTDGRNLVSRRPSEFPWPARPVDSIDDAVSKINDEPTAILLVDKMTAPDDDVRRAFENVAKPHFDRRQEGDSSKPISFATASAEDEMTDNLRQLFGLAREKEGPTTVGLHVVDAPSGFRYAMKHDGIPDERSMAEFIDRVLDGREEGIPLG